MSEENKTAQNVGEEIQRLPLWRAALDEMLEMGVDYGNTYPATWFEERLKVKRDTMRFGLDISEIRKRLEKLGFYLCGRGQGGNQFSILPPEGNASVMDQYKRAALTAMTRGVVLGTNTRLDSLKAEDRRRHESILEKMATLHCLCSKSKAVMKYLGDDAEKVLGKAA